MKRKLDALQKQREEVSVVGSSEIWSSSDADKLLEFFRRGDEDVTSTLEFAAAMSASDSSSNGQSTVAPARLNIGRGHESRIVSLPPLSEVLYF